jgi:Flp pilus assembly protein TadD
LRFNPNRFNAWLGLGVLAQKHGNTEEAIRDLSRSVQLQPTVQAYFELGRAFEQAGRFAEAREAYRRAREGNGGPVSAPAGAAGAPQ